MEVDVILIFDWRDGPVEGVVRRTFDDSCWHFRLMAERLENENLNDRLFSLTALPESDAAVLVAEFGAAAPGTHVWPVDGGLGSAAAQRIVESMFTGGSEPDLIVRTADLMNIDDVWQVIR